MKTLPIDLKFYNTDSSIIITDDLEYAKQQRFYPSGKILTETNLNGINKTLGLIKSYIIIKNKLEEFDLNKFIKELKLTVFHEVKITISAKKFILKNLYTRNILFCNNYENSEVYVSNSIIEELLNVSKENVNKLTIINSVIEFKEERLRQNYINIEIYNSVFKDNFYMSSFYPRDIINVTAYNSYLSVATMILCNFIFNIKGKGNKYKVNSARLHYKDVSISNHCIRIGNTFILSDSYNEEVKYDLDKITDIKEIKKLLNNIKVIKYVESFTDDKHIGIKNIENNITKYLTNRLSNISDN